MMLDQHCVRAVDVFFAEYRRIWDMAHSLSPQELLLAEEDSDVFSTRDKLLPPQLGRNELSELSTICGTQIPSCYGHFLTKYSWHELDVPLCKFPPTTSLDELTEMSRKCSGTGLVPIAWPADDSINLLCIDTTDNNCIIHCDHRNLRRDMNTICRSFGQLIEIIMVYRTAEPYGRGENMIAMERTNRIAKSIDPHVFGDSAWCWWKPFIRIMFPE